MVKKLGTTSKTGGKGKEVEQLTNERQMVKRAWKKRKWQTWARNATTPATAWRTQKMIVKFCRSFKNLGGNIFFLAKKLLTLRHFFPDAAALFAFVVNR